MPQNKRILQVRREEEHERNNSGRGKRNPFIPDDKGRSKQLLPIYDKAARLLSYLGSSACGDKEILIISTPQDIDDYRNLLGDGFSSE